MWKVENGERMQSFTGHTDVSFSVTWSTSGEILISGGGDGSLYWLEVQSAHCVRVQNAHQGTVQALKMSPDGSIPGSRGGDGATIDELVQAVGSNPTSCTTPLSIDSTLDSKIAFKSTLISTSQRLQVSRTLKPQKYVSNRLYGNMERTNS